MATNKRVRRIADKVEEAAGKASVKIQDKASDAAKDIRQAGRDLDDRVRQTAGAASEYVERETGVPASKTKQWIVAGIWVLGIVVMIYVAARIFG